VHRFAKGFEEAQLEWILPHLVFRVPLDAEEKIVAGAFHGFNDAIARVLTADHQGGSQRFDRLVVTRVDRERCRAGDGRKQATRFHGYLVNRSGTIGQLHPMALYRLQVLDQGAAQAYVEQLQSTTDRKGGHIVGKRLAEQVTLKFIALEIRRVGFLVPGFAVHGWVDIAAAGEQQAPAVSKRHRVTRLRGDRYDGRGVERFEVWDGCFLFSIGN
jgi:hypothetical protein